MDNMTRDTISPSDTIAIQSVLVAVRQAADAICDRWSLLLIAAVFDGESRFSGFLERVGIANRLAVSRLNLLCDLGVLMRVPYSVRPPRDEFLLTNMGKALLPVLRHMASWDRDWHHGTVSGNLLKGPLGENISVALACGRCGQTTSAREISLKLNKAQLQATPKKTGHHRRSIVTSHNAKGATFGLTQSLDVFGDKWSIEIILLGFFRVHRFSDFSDKLGIAANTLTDRLEGLIRLAIFELSDARGYHLTNKGIALYGVLVTIQSWADAWLPKRYKSPVQLIHTTCGHVFKPVTLIQPR
jgi:DNA-binding HxlR family transcriptional regulator